MESKRIRVLIADDHPAIRAGVRTAFAAEDDLDLVGEASDGDTTLIMCQTTQPDVILLDLHMPGPPPLILLSVLREQCSAVRVLVMTAYTDGIYVRSAVVAGVAGYVLKDEPLETVVGALRTVARGGTWFSPAVLATLIAEPPKVEPTAHPALSERESAVLRLVIQGRSDQDISRELGIAERTVRYNLRNIYDKLEVTSRVEAAVRAVQLNLA